MHAELMHYHGHAQIRVRVSNPEEDLFLSSWWWGFSICTERRDAHEQALVVLRGKRIREKRKLLLLLKIWNEAWK
jgi:hypothetical protein